MGRTAAQGRIPALKRTVFTSHGENARRIGRIRREPALSGAFRSEGTPHFARSFLPSPECRQNFWTGWWRKRDLNSRDPSAFDGRDSARVRRTNRPEKKASVPERICSPRILLFFGSLLLHSFATLMRGIW